MSVCPLPMFLPHFISMQTGIAADLHGLALTDRLE